MPQFDFAYFLPQMAWLAILFAILYFVVVRATLPKVGKVMQAREDKVMGDINTAQAAKAEADGVSDAYHAELHRAQDAARAEIASSRAEAQKGIEARLAEVDRAIDGRLAEAQSALDTARSAALAQVEAIAADAAGAIVERLTGTRPAGDQANAAARSALGQA